MTPTSDPRRIAHLEAACEYPSADPLHGGELVPPPPWLCEWEAHRWVTYDGTAFTWDACRVCGLRTVAR